MNPTRFKLYLFYKNNKYNLSSFAVVRKPEILLFTPDYYSYTRRWQSSIKNMQLNRSIAYTYSWKYTLLISIILSAFICIIQIFLQPFDTYYYQSAYKNIKLIGYSICIFPPILFLHIFENHWFLKNKKKWKLIGEITILTLGFISICTLAYLYNSLVINSVSVNWKSAVKWAYLYGLPFAPVFIPLWVYLRFRFSKIVIISDTQIAEELITIKGKNNQEKIQFIWSEFVMAKSQSNYVDIFLIGKKGESEKHIMRTTLSGLIEQLPMATQVHRSYLINTNYITNLKGNTRKGSVVLGVTSIEVPVSPKHFTALKSNLQSHP